ncbi:MAG TPA: DHHW family protein [Chitinophagaceae bacterium]|nr:DHHW family protein [Chitinophagaceae bacterium]
MFVGHLKNSSDENNKKGKTDSTEIAKPQEAPLPPRFLPDDSLVGVKRGGVFVYRNRGFEMFSGGQAMGQKYADVMNMYYRLHIPGLKIYNLIIPIGFEFEMREKYKNLNKPNKEVINQIFSEEDSGIIKINPVDEIRRHRTEYIYFNTDHHWTSLGAYYAYRSFCKAAGLTPVSLDTIPSKVKPNFLGLFYRFTKAQVLKNNPDSVRYYLFPDSVNFYIGSSQSISYWAKSTMYAENVSDGSSYSVFLHGDLPICKMETQHKNGRRICLVKESYGNAFAPFLVNNYEKVVVVDQREYKGDFLAMLKAEGINELLFINNIFAAHTQFHIDDIRGLAGRRAN